MSHSLFLFWDLLFSHCNRLPKLSSTTSHPGLLSLSHPFVCTRFEYAAKAVDCVVNRHIVWYSSLYMWYCSVGLVSGWRTSLT